MGPKVPPLSLAAVRELAACHVPFKWQRDVVQGLVMYERAEHHDRVQAGARLAEVTSKALHHVAAGEHDPYVQRQPAADQHDGVPARRLGACFRCGLYGHWACVTQPAARPRSSTGPNIGVAPRKPSASPLVSYASSPSPTSVPNPTRPGGGLSMVGAQTLYVAASIGRTYNASRPPPYPCVRCRELHWHWQPCSPRAANHEHPVGSAPLGPRPPGP